MKRKLINKITLIIVSVFVLLASGCSSNSAKGTVSKFCDAMKTLNIEEMGKYTGNSNANLKLDNTGNAYADSLIGIVKKYANKMTYKIIDEKVEGNSSFVTVEFEYLDSSDAVMYAMKELYNLSSGKDFDDEFNENEIMNKLISDFEGYLKQDSSKRAKQTIVFNCVKNNNTWIITGFDSTNIVQVLTCNVQNALRSAVSSLR